MTALIRFELQKVWRKGSFLSLMALLLLLNVFFPVVFKPADRG